MDSNTNFAHVFENVGNFLFPVSLKRCKVYRPFDRMNQKVCHDMKLLR